MMTSWMSQVSHLHAWSQDTSKPLVIMLPPQLLSCHLTRSDVPGAAVYEADYQPHLAVDFLADIAVLENHELQAPSAMRIMFQCLHDVRFMLLPVLSDERWAVLVVTLGDLNFTWFDPNKVRT